ncbi:MAG: hypothetical protein IPI57_12875 [Candidatus Competibacteraceae bacterium]|nr:hypothetical protein [Candidatus Competibacteraceae bacterium]
MELYAGIEQRTGQIAAQMARKRFWGEFDDETLMFRVVRKGLAVAQPKTDHAAGRAGTSRGAQSPNRRATERLSSIHFLSM